MSRDWRVAREVMLGLSFYQYLGDRLGLGIIDQPVPPLPTIILARA